MVKWKLMEGTSVPAEEEASKGKYDSHHRTPERSRRLRAQHMVEGERRGKNASLRKLA